jgi:hypothetical protein
MMEKIGAHLRCVVLGLALLGGWAWPALAQQGNAGWLTAWATSTQDPLPGGFAVGNPALTSPEWAQMFPNSQASDQVFRMIVRANAAGEQVSLRFSNYMGTKPVTFDTLSIARRDHEKAVVAGSSRPIRFGGTDKVTIAPGRDAVSDPVAFAVTPGEDVAVTFHLVGQSGPITWHAKAMTTSWMSAPGAGAASIDDAGTGLPFGLRSWVWLTELQAYKAGAERSAIVAVGDSITDGSGTTIDGNDRWVDFLNRRLLERFHADWK